MSLLFLLHQIFFNIFLHFLFWIHFSDLWIILWNSLFSLSYPPLSIPYRLFGFSLFVCELVYWLLFLYFLIFHVSSITSGNLFIDKSNADITLFFSCIFLQLFCTLYSLSLPLSLQWASKRSLGSLLYYSIDWQFQIQFLLLWSVSTRYH